MPVAALLEFQVGDKDVGLDWYERVSREVAGKDRFEQRSDWTGGMLAHVAGYTDDGAIWAVDVWESQEDMDRWMQTVMPILEPAVKEFGEPTVRVLNVHNLVTEG